jgi:hypothetical protein
MYRLSRDTTSRNPKSLSRPVQGQNVATPRLHQHWKRLWRLLHYSFLQTLNTLMDYVTGLTYFTSTWSVAGEYHYLVWTLIISHISVIQKVNSSDREITISMLAVPKLLRRKPPFSALWICKLANSCALPQAVRTRCLSRKVRIQLLASHVLLTV